VVSAFDRSKLSGSGRIVELALELLHEALEHRVGPWSMRLVDRGSPHLPPLDQRARKEQLDQLEVESALALERAELFEVVEFAIQHVALGASADT
jgi:hypothetical protein